MTAARKALTVPATWFVPDCDTCPATFPGKFLHDTREEADAEMERHGWGVRLGKVQCAECMAGGLVPRELACPHCGADFTGDGRAYRTHTQMYITASTVLCQGRDGHDWQPVAQGATYARWECAACPPAARGRVYDSSD